MPIIWEDHEKAKRLSQSQPLRIDWLTALIWLAALILCAVAWGLLLGRMFHAH